MSLVVASYPRRYSQEMRVLTEDHKPFQYIDEQGKVAGFRIELVTMIFKEAGVAIKDGKIRIYPWSRAYDIALNEKILRYL